MSAPSTRRWIVGAWLALASLSVSQASAESDRRLERIRQRITRLEVELELLRSNELGILGELEKLSAEIQLREAEQQAVTIEVDAVRERITLQTATLDTLRDAQGRRREYLRFRLREQYKAGENGWLRRWLDDAGASVNRKGFRYADFLSSRDARILQNYRESEQQIEREQRVMLVQEAELDRASQSLAVARRTLRTARRRHSTQLDLIRTDSHLRETALIELRNAADDLGAWVAGSRVELTDPGLNVGKFRGLLDWPAAGEVSTGFGTQIHPRFKTKIPHPGLDIEGSFGSPIKSIFEGEVVYAAWMRGYGLTAIVDHGGQVLSIYAHASALLVEPGDHINAGQRIGLVGDSGSLRGSYLYFEIRESGKAVDPAVWMRQR